MAFSIHDKTWQARKATAILHALVKIANDQETPYDFFISKMIWAVSLYLESGDYKENWKTRLRASDAAIRVRNESRDWKSLVTFEHARTLYDTFGLLQQAISIDDAAETIAAYPPVLITRRRTRALTREASKSLARLRKDTRKLKSRRLSFVRFRNHRSPATTSTADRSPISSECAARPGGCACTGSHGPASNPCNACNAQAHG
jgi:hypothetical protein